MAEGCDKMLREGALRLVKIRIKNPPADVRQMAFAGMEPHIRLVAQQLKSRAYFIPNDKGLVELYYRARAKQHPGLRTMKPFARRRSFAFAYGAGFSVLYPVVLKLDLARLPSIPRSVSFFSARTDRGTSSIRRSGSSHRPCTGTVGPLPRHSERCWPASSRRHFRNPGSGEF
jgi:hypothetical protein